MKTADTPEREGKRTNRKAERVGQSRKEIPQA